MLELPNVTLLCADTVNHALALRALERSRRDIRFGRVAFLTDRLPGGTVAPPDIDVVPIEALPARDAYSRLMLKGLVEHVHTSHVLVVQWDGYVVNPGAWDPQFLECDYLGAKWFWYTDGGRVGNGGFSLRSRRLLEALADARVQVEDAEDICIGRIFRPMLERDHGIRFGSEVLADRFSFEAAYPVGAPFGFHGLFNFARVVPPAEVADLADAFSDDIARSLQYGQLLRNCAALGQWSAVAALATRRLQVLPNDAAAAKLLTQAQAGAVRVPAARRNDPCPCGSGKRYKQCHGALGATPGAARPAVDALALAQQGVELHRSGDVAAAENAYRAALQSEPEQPLALHYLGVIEYQRKRFDSALPMLERAAAAVPGEAEFHNNLGLALAAVDRVDDAVAAYRRAVALRDQHATAWNNLGLAYTAQNELAQADAAFSRAIALEPRFAAAHWNRGIALLAAGRYEDGWPEYEWRLAVRDFNDAATAPRAPRWKGEPIAGARILLRAEQGLGDTIQAVRFARDLHEAGMSVLARIPRKLERLVRTVPGIADVSCDDEPWPAVDAEIRMMSVPGALKVTRETVPSPIPYVAVDAGKRRAAEHAVRARAGTRRSIGLAWAGSPDNANDRRRSAPLSLFAPLLARPDIEWFSLQHDDEHAVAAVTDATALHRIEERIDFDGMAAMIDVLDLVISVDTSVVHVAGALARPVWILLPFAPDWRWGVSGASTPWYPTARLFRQPRIGDWTAVIDAVGRALDELR